MKKVYKFDQKIMSLQCQWMAFRQCLDNIPCPLGTLTTLIQVHQQKISTLPILNWLGRTVTFLNYLISSMYNCVISKTRKLPEFQSNYIPCYIHLYISTVPVSAGKISSSRRCSWHPQHFFNLNFKHLGVLGMQSTNGFSTYNKISYAMLRNLPLFTPMSNTWSPCNLSIKWQISRQVLCKLCNLPSCLSLF